MVSIPLLLALLGPAVVFGSGLAWIRGVPDQTASPILRPALEALAVLDDPEAMLLLGNSVAMAGVDGRLVGELTGHPLAHAGISGSLPPHWLALLRHQVVGKGEQARVVLLYAPAHNLRDTDVSAPTDLANLVDLMEGGDAELLAFGGPEAEAQVRARQANRPAEAERFQRDRVRARESLLQGLKDLAIFVASPLPGATPEALDQLMGPITPNDAGDRFSATPGQAAPGQVEGAGPGSPSSDRPGTGQQGGTSGEGRVAHLEDSVIPALLAEVQAQGGRLVVVHPAARPDIRPRCTGDGLSLEGDAWLMEAGADVLDLSFADLKQHHFTNQHHLSEEGRERLSRTLAEALAAVAPIEQAPAAPGRRWVLDCQGRLAQAGPPQASSTSEHRVVDGPDRPALIGGDRRAPPRGPESP